MNKVNIEAIPHAGLDRIYFPHTTTGPEQTTTNLEAGWTAGLTARAGFPISPVLDFVLSADYTSMVTDRGFGFTVRGPNGLVNRSPLQRMDISANIAYKLFKKVEEVEMTPEDIQEMIEEKEDDMDMDKGNDDESKDIDLSLIHI